MNGIRVAVVADDTAIREAAVGTLDGFEVLPTTPEAATGLSARQPSGGGGDDGRPDPGAVVDEGDAGAVDCVVVVHDEATTDALGLLRGLREAEPDLPLVLFTAAGSERLASEALRAGADDYVARTDDSEGWTVLRNRIEHVVAERRAESRLAESERTVSTLVANLPGVLYRVRPGGEVAFLDGDVRELTGHPAAAFVDGEEVWWDVVHPADRDRARAVVDEALAARESFEVTYRLRPDDTRWVTDRGRGVFVDGDLEAVEGVLTDVTDRQRRDEQVRDLHAATRRLVAADTRDEIAEVTVAAAHEVLGYRLNGVRLLDSAGEYLVPAVMTDESERVLGERPDYPVDASAPVPEVFRTGEPRIVDDVTTIADDRDRGGLRSALYLPLAGQGTLSVGATEQGAFDAEDRQLAGLLADNAGAALAAVAQREALENERDRLAALFENVPEPTVRVTFGDGEQTVREVNPAFEETFGLAEETVTGEPLDEFIVPEGDRERAAEFNRRIRAGEAFDAEVRRRTADGVRDFLLHVVPRELDAGTTEGFGIYTDITDRKARERELERQNERLEEFAGVLSHDLRNPLNVASGRLANYRETGDPADLEKVAAAQERIRERIEDLLELARQGRTVDTTEPVPLAEAARVAWGVVDTADATLAVETAAVVPADRRRLERLLENLFRNAVEHGSTDSRTQSDDAGSASASEPSVADAPDDAVEHGSTSPASQARQDSVEHGSSSSRPQSDAESDRDGAEGRAADGGPAGLTVTVDDIRTDAGEAGGFYVADDGVGISSSVRDDLFESGVSTGGGTGFGLAIVQSIAEAHGWQVRATDGEAGGARFEFTGLEPAD